MADRIIVLQEGRLAEIGTHDQLMHREGLYWRLYQQSDHATFSDGDPEYIPSDRIPLLKL